MMKKLIYLLLCLPIGIGIANAQTTSITGTVISAEDGEPVIGATVQVKGTTVGSITDVDGNFSVVVTAGNTLVFSYLGLETVEMAARDKMIVKLTTASQLLDAVVVVGYGTQKKETLTGSVANLAGAEIVKSPAANIATSLAGKLPGLIVNQRSGQPGADDPDIYIRGASSFASGNSPLIIIDGVERDHMGRLNSEDIESYSVLKDASAAIYGARAANGVILITTKKGSIGKPVFSVTHNTSFSRPTTTPDMLNAADYATVFNEGIWYRAGRPSGNHTPFYSDEVIAKYRDGSDPVLYPNTDWVREIMKPHSIQNRTSIQATGGSESVRYLFSYAFQNQGSAFYNNPSGYKQHNVRVSVTADLNKYLTVGANISAILGERQESSVGSPVDVFTNVYLANPTLVARYPNGLTAPGRLGENPLLLDQRGYSKISNTPIYSTFTASLKIPYVEGLKAEGSFNYDLRNQFTKRWDLPYYYHEYNVQTGEYDRKQGTGVTTISLQDTYAKWTTMMYNLRLVYENTFAQDHNVSAMIGMEQQKNKSSNANAYRKNFLSSQLPELNVGSNASEDKNNGGSSSASARDTYFGRFNYNYKSKYLAEFIFRYDGSANFMTGKQYGFFPAASVGWRMSEEEFMRQAMPFVDQLKLRFSVGQTGNDRVNAFQYLQTYSFAGNYVFGNSDASAIRPGTMPNTDITWEISTKYDLGMDATLWKGLLGFELTFFQEDRSHILAKRNLSIPNTFGFTGLPDENIGKTTNKGFEFLISHRNRVNKDFSYNISANLSYAKSKIVYMDETPNTEEYRNQTGRPIGAGLYYEADGIFHTQEELDAYPHHRSSQVGDLRIVDLNDDGKIDSNDQFRFGYTATPRTVFGLNTSFQYRDFDLTLSFQGQAGVYNYDRYFAPLGSSNFDNAYIERAADRWTVSNPNGSMPRSDAWQPGNTTFFLNDASFIRLKNAELGYSLPQQLISKAGLTNLRVYVSGFNLLTWAKEIKWSDPELSGGSLYYPQQRVINLGVNVKF
ncbi:TonB-dependent receptor [Parabacteroides sp. OttesenSCG-928-J18]|nr:TonB-dependent receptor [Parabacteroides sp. OttesenSCG-928-J18]